MSPHATLHCGDALTVLQTLPEESVQCVVSSPAYWGLRDYKVPPQVWGGDSQCAHEWTTERWYTERSAAATSGSREAFSAPGLENAARLKAARWRQADTCEYCDAWRGQLGLEPTPQLYIEHLVAVFREVRRVLRQDGTLWLNIGDCYHSGDRGGYRLDSHRWEKSEMQSQRANRGGSGIPLAPNRLPQDGLKDKDLVGIPWMLAFALRADGWWLRFPVIWHKPNGMPSSQRDRPTLNYEYVFLLSRGPQYYYDPEAIAERLAPTSIARLNQRTWQQQAGSTRANAGTKTNGPMKAVGGQRKRSGNLKRDITSAEDGRGILNNHYGRGVPWEDETGTRTARGVWTIPVQAYSGAHFATMPEELARRCILAGSRPGGVVLDPFGGSGTVAAVAVGHGRSAIYVDLNPAYLELARQRIGPMLCEVSS